MYETMEPTLCDSTIPKVIPLILKIVFDLIQENIGNKAMTQHLGKLTCYLIGAIEMGDRVPRKALNELELLCTVGLLGSLTEISCG